MWSELWPWIVFGAVVVVLLTLDLAFFHRRGAHRSTSASALWSALFIGVGLSFAFVVGYARGAEAAFQYLTAFLIEESLSVDNLFVFLALFTYFGVPREHQHRVLFWGIVGAIVMRGLFITAGVALIHTFRWLIYVLGVLLIATGAKLGLGKGEEVHPERNLIVRWASRVLPLVRSYEGDHFTVRRNGRLLFTPLALVLLAVESTDLMFAVDSVPAVLAVSRDLFVIYTSNVFAVMGLRAIYSLLSGVLAALRFLRPALALILMLVGAKMLLSGVVEIPTLLSLAVVGAILTGATVLSLLSPGPPAAPDD
jgi:TerC family integral membrane protein